MVSNRIPLVFSFNCVSWPSSAHPNSRKLEVLEGLAVLKKLKESWSGTLLLDENFSAVLMNRIKLVENMSGCLNSELAIQLIWIMAREKLGGLVGF